MDELEPQYVYVDEWGKDVEAALTSRPRVKPFCLHPHFYKDLGDFRKAEELLQRFENLNLVLDTAHQYLAGDDIIDIFLKYRNRIPAVHLRDWSDRYGRSPWRFARGFCPLGQGILPPVLENLIRALHETNFNGWVVIEQDLPPGNPSEAAWSSIRWLKACLERVRSPTIFRSPQSPVEVTSSTQKEAGARTLDFAFVERIRSSILKPSIQDLPTFFRCMAQEFQEVFEASFVSIWENNVYTDNLFLLAHSASPGSAFKPNCSVLPRKQCLTGLAIERTDCVIVSGLAAPFDSRRLFNTGLLDGDLSYLVSIPVFNAYDSNLVSFVINLYFKTDPVPVFNSYRMELDWISNTLSLTVDYLLYRIEDDLRHRIDLTPERGIGFYPFLAKAFTELRRLADHDRGILINHHLEGNRWDIHFSAPPLGTLRGAPSATTLEANMYLEDDAINAYSVKHREGTVSFECAPQAHTWRAFIPISKSRRGLDFLVFCGKINDFCSGSSLHLCLLESFAKVIGPWLLRYYQWVDGTSLLQVMREVCAIGPDERLEGLLQRTIDALGKRLSASMGSVYLLENTSEGASLVMRAGFGPDRDLIGEANYKIGEGITGSIASKGVINLKTKQQRQEYPERKGKYAARLRYPSDVQGKSEAFLGVRIQSGNKVLGVWKIEYINPTSTHPDPYFTAEDVNLSLLLSSFLAYAIELEHVRKASVAKDFKLFATTVLELENVTTEDDAVCVTMSAIEKSRFQSAMFSRYDPNSEEIIGHIPSGAKWQRICSMTKRHIDSGDILAIILRTGESEFIKDSQTDPRCDNDAARLAGIFAHYAVPVRTATEMIGTVQVDMGNRKWLDEDEKLIIQALVATLTSTILRIRQASQLSDVTEQILRSSRFVTAEALTGLVVHSLGRRLDEITRTLSLEIARAENDPTLKHFLEGWLKLLEEGHSDLELGLRALRPRRDDDPVGPINIHSEIQKTLDTWYLYIRHGKCVIDNQCTAEFHTALAQPYELREIISVLLVNAVQAYARKIVIRTYNLRDIEAPKKNYMRDAIAVEVTDDGLGIVTDDLEELFKPTYTTKPEKFGTGLGLFFARLLAKRAGGHLEAKPKRRNEKGATFVLTLPVVVSSQRNVGTSKRA